MFKRRCCKNGQRRSTPPLLGPILIALGIGVFIAYIIPNYLLIALFGIALVIVGIRFICK